MLELDPTRGTGDHEQTIVEPKVRASELSRNSAGQAVVIKAPRKAPRLIRSRIGRQLAAAVAVLLAFLSRQALAQDSPGFPPYLTFFPVIVLAALLGDVWTGIVATALSALLAAVYILEPTGRFKFSDPADLIGLVIFCFTGAFVSAVIELYHRNRERLSAYRVQEAIVNERRAVDEAREAAEDTLGSIGDAVIATDRNGRITFLNSGAVALTGWKPEEAQGQPIQDVFKIINEQTRMAAADIVPQVLDEGLRVKAADNAVLITKSGQETPLEHSAAPIHDSSGKATGVVLVFRDVTQKRQIQAAQAEREALLELARDAITVLDLDFTVHFWNRGAEEAYGFSKEVATGRNAPELLHTIFPKPVSEIKADLLREGYWEGELMPTTRDGRRIVMASRWALQRGKNDRLSRVMTISTDITARKAVEAALRESEGAFTTLANLVPQLVWMSTPDGLSIYFNHRWVEYTGLTQEQSRGKGWNTPFHPDDRQAAVDAWNRAIQTGGPHRIESRLRAADGSYRWFLIRAVPLRNTEGTIIRWFGTCTDIEDLKQAEQQLRALTARLQRVREEERTMVARDLHDQIGQILTVIKMDLSWLAKRLPRSDSELSDRVKGTIEMINDGIRSVRAICSGLRPGILDDLGLAAAIEWQANEFASRTGIQCQVDVPAAEVKLDGDRSTALFRIFQESLTNVARHAEARSVHASLYEQDENLMLVVEDDGRGFSKSNVSDSLGLLGMKERAQMCGGDAEISSFPGNGTRITVRFPLHAVCAELADNAHTDS